MEMFRRACPRPVYATQWFAWRASESLPGGVYELSGEYFTKDGGSKCLRDGDWIIQEDDKVFSCSPDLFLTSFKPMSA